MKITILRGFSTLLVLFFAFSYVAKAQNLKAEYDNLNTLPKFINVCGDPEKATVTVSPEGTSLLARQNIKATLNLFPKGVRFVELVEAESTTGVTLNNPGNLYKPEFTLPTVKPGELTRVKIVFKVAADCGFVDTLAKNNNLAVYDEWTLAYNLGNSPNVITEKEKTADYRDAFVVPFFTMATTVKNYPNRRGGDCFDRNIQVNNSGLKGFVNRLFYSNKQAKGISIKGIKINGQSIPFTKEAQPNGDTLVSVKIEDTYFVGNKKGTGGAGNGDKFFDPDENMLITESVCIVDCVSPTNSTHDLGWGCYDEICNSIQINDFIPIGIGNPNPVLTNAGSIEDKLTGYCKLGQTVMTVKNEGTEIDPGFGTMRDVTTGIGIGSGYATSIKGYKLTALTIAGKTIPLTATSLIDLNNNPLFKTDPDGSGGLEDADNDGYFDDLKVGQKFEMTAKYEFDCNSAKDTAKFCTNDRNAGISAVAYYTDACGERLNKDKTNYINITNNNTAYENTTDPDAYIGTQDTFFVTHFEERSIFFFEKECGADGALYAKIYLPKGVTPLTNIMQLFKNGNTTPEIIKSSNIKNDTLTLFFDASSQYLTGKYLLKMAFVATCDANVGISQLPFEFGFNCPSCNCWAPWYCSTLRGPTLHGSPTCKQPPCPIGVRTITLDARRATYGYTDATFTTKINPKDANQKIAISCDSVNLTLKGIVGDAVVNGGLSAVYTYDNIPGKGVNINDTRDIFQFGKGTFIFKNNGVLKTCPVPASAAKVEANGKDKKVSIDLSSCFAAGEKLSPSDSVRFVGSFAVNPDGPYPTQFKVVPNLRGYMVVKQGNQELICDDFGDNFTIAKNQTVFDFPNSSSFPKGCDKTELEYKLITVNNGFSDFFKKEYRQALKVDSIRLNFDPAFLSSFDSLNVEYSIPGHPTFGNNFIPLPPLSTAKNGVYTAKFTDGVVPALNNVSSYSFNFRISATPSCRSLTGSAKGNNQFNFDATMKYKDRYYANFIGDGSCAKDSTVVVNDQDLYYSEPPVLTLNPVGNAIFDLVGDTVTWTVKVCNTAVTADAGATYIAIDNPNPQLQIMSVEDVTDPFAPAQKLAMTKYGLTNQSAFALTKGLKRADGTNAEKEICNTLRIKAISKVCGNFEVTAKTGWSCAAFPSDFNPDKYSPCKELSTKLRVNGLEAALDAEIDEGFLKNPDLCDTIFLDLLVKNTGRASAFDVKTQLWIPAKGATIIPGSVSIAYPASAAFKPIPDPTFVSIDTKGKLLQYTNFASLNPFLASNGLPGFNPAAPNDSNQYKIRYKMVTDCDFKSGTVTFFSVQGRKGCGDLTNLETGESVPIKIQGAVVNNNVKAFDIDITTNTNVLPNSASTIEVSMVNLTDILTDDKDKFTITLPKDFTYAPNTAKGIEPATWTPGEPMIQNQNGLVSLTWGMPIGIGQDATMKISFKVNTPAFDCNNAPEFNATISTLSTRTLTCKSNPGTVCVLDVVTSKGGENIVALPTGAAGKLGIEFGRVTSICAGIALESVTANANVKNLEDKAFDAGNSLDITYYYDTNGNKMFDATEKAIKTFNVAGPIPAKGSIAVQHKFDASIDDICKIQVEVKPKGGFCDLTNTKLPTPQLLNAGKDRSFCVDDKAIKTTLGDDNCTHNTYRYNWTAIAPADTKFLSNTTIANPTTDFIWKDNYPDTLTFVLETDRQAGCDLTRDTISLFRSKPLSLDMGPSVKTPPGGSVTLNPIVTGGAQPLTFLWTPPTDLSSATILNPTAAPKDDRLYTLKVTDAGGCMAIGNILVTIHNCDTITAIAKPDTTVCAGQKVQFMAGGGTNYWWLPYPDNPTGGALSNYFIANPVFMSDVPNATYKYVVLVTSTTLKNAMDTATVVIKTSGVPKLSIDIIGNTNFCLGTGSVKLAANGAVSYMWSAGNALISNDQVITVSPSVPTVYTVKGANEYGCTATKDVKITPAEGVVIKAITKDTAICPGAMITLNVEAVGGTGTYTYAWTGGGLSNPSIKNPVVKPVGSTTYKVTVVDKNGCSGTAQVKVDSLGTQFCPVCMPPTIDITHIGKASSCTKPDGFIILYPWGGHPEKFNYVWSPNIGKLGGQGESRSELPAGTYTVKLITKTDTTCSSTATIVVPNASQGATAQISIANVVKPICKKSNGSVTVNITIGSSFTLPADTVITDLKGAIVKNGQLGEGEYIVSVYDAKKCNAASASFKIEGCIDPNNSTENKIVLNATTSPKCFGDATGSIDYTIFTKSDFKKPAKVIITDPQGVKQYDNGKLVGGNYLVTLKDSLGDTKATLNFTIQSAGLLLAIKTVKDACDTTNTKGSISFVVNGGTAPYTYKWSDLTAANQAKDRTDLAKGIYTIKITDANNCSIEVSSEVKDNCIKGNPGGGGNTNKVTIKTTTDVKCFGGSDGGVETTLTLSPDFKAPAKVEIKDATGQLHTNGQLSAGSYVILVLDATGATQATTNVIIKEPKQLITITTVKNACDTTNTKGAIALFVTGGTSPYTYVWADLTSATQTQNRSNLPKGIYKITVSDANACNVEASAEVKDDCIKNGSNPNPTAENKIILKTVSDAKCFGTANGAIDYTAVLRSDFKQPAKVIITDKKGTKEYDNGKIPAGDFLAILSDADGNNKDTITFTIHEPTQLLAIAKTTNACDTTKVKGSISVTVTGGTTPYVYQWEDLSATGQSANRTDLAKGTYVLQVEDAHNCTVSIKADVADPCSTNNGGTGKTNLLLANAKDLKCPGDSVKILVNMELAQNFKKPAKVSIKFNASPEKPVFNNEVLVGAGGYCIMLRDADGVFADSSCFVVHEPAPWEVFETLSEACNGQGGAINIEVSGATAPYIYDWKDITIGIEPQDRTDLAEGTYSVTVIDAAGCKIPLPDAIVTKCPLQPEPCPDVLLADTLNAFMPTCKGKMDVCIPSNADFATLKFTLDGKATTAVTECPKGIYYKYGNLPTDPYEVNEWKINNKAVGGKVVNLKGLVDSMNVWDKGGNWKIDTVHLFITGGNAKNVYGPINIVPITPIGEPFVNALNPMTFLKGVLVTLQGAGTHKLLVTNPTTGCKDSTFVIVNCDAPLPKPDTIRLNLYVSESDTICLDTSELKAGIVSLSQKCGNVYVADLKALKQGCIQFKGVNVGEDTICVIACDQFNFCDTTYIILDVNKRIKDITEVIHVGDTSLYCINLKTYGLKKPVSLKNVCPKLANGNVEFVVKDSLNSDCIYYKGLKVGVDTACIQVCEANGNCQTFHFYITVIPAITGKIIKDTIVVGDEVTYCIKPIKAKGKIISIANICPDAANGFVKFELDSATYCITYKGLKVGKGTACIVTCDDNQVCDTTEFQIWVIPTKPIAVNDTSTVKITKVINIPILDNDDTGNAEVEITILKAPLYGQATVTASSEIQYEAGDECPKLDSLIYSICNANGCDTATVYIKVECIKVIVHDGFSPNNDGINDNFTIEDIEFFPESEVSVFNRWGNKVMQTKGYKNDWNAKWQGDDLPDGTYFFILELHDKEKTNVHGTLQIER